MKKIIILLIVFLGGIITFYVSHSSDSSENFKSIFQENVDKEFKKTDKEIEQYLYNMAEAKDYCFGPNKKKTFMECVDEVEKKFDLGGDYLKAYTKACMKALEDTLEQEEDKAVGVRDSLQILNPYTGICNRLAEHKIDIYKNVAYDILKKNKTEVLKDERKKMIQKEREKYDRVTDLMRRVGGNRERFEKKWPSKTKKDISG